MKDPYYRKILERLGGPLDRAAFEECAVSLLKKDAYPGLVPVHGGHDYGQDGASADGEGEAFPLIVTTAADVLRNLTKNLDAYVAGNGPRRRAVVATSTGLPATKRKNLQERAQEKGFRLLQIHDKWDFADRLYRDSRWAKELLGVTGEPSALSAVPRTNRPLREDVELIGREADLNWLRETSGDRVIIGQPGAGKTYLLLRLVREGRALFLAGEDEERIAADLRDLEPEIVIVDDAHLAPERLARLRQIREEIGAGFDLLVTGWPGSEADLLEALALPSKETVRRLELLTRKQILEILRGIGVQEPDDDPYLRVLIDQAANKPGLAATLGSLWLRDEWLDVLTGKAIKRTLLPTLKRVLGSDPTELLACFALGGDSGVSLEVVREFLGLDRERIRQQVVRASHGGVLKVLGDDRLAVEPEALRPALLEEVFFTPPALDYRSLLTQAADKEDATEVLALAARCGAAVPMDNLRALIKQVRSRKAWWRLATLGEDSGRWVLENYSGDVEDIIHPVLESAPKAAVHLLLERAGAAQGPLHSQPEHPLRILQDWVQAPEFAPGRGDAVLLQKSLSRRALVVREAKSFMETEGDSVLGLRACLFALSPRLEISRETVTGGSIRIRTGVLPSGFVPKILDLWARVRDLIDEFTRELWADVEELLQHWVYPETLTLGRPLPEDDVEKMSAVPQQILSDLKGFAEGRPGLQWALLKWAERIQLSLDLDADASFGVLFPLEEHITAENWQEEEEALAEATREYAVKCASQPPAETVKRLAFYQRESEIFTHSTVEVAAVFYRTLAEVVDEPEEWLRSLVECEIRSSYVGHFLRRTVREKRPGWSRFLEECLRTEEYSWLAASEVIRSEEIPDQLLCRALDRIPSHHVETECHRREVPLSNLLALLRLPRQEVAVAAAVGEWLADPEERVRDVVRDDWRQAILRYGAGTEVDRSSHPAIGHWLKEIFKWAPELALEWLQSRVRDSRDKFLTEHGIYHAAVQALDPEQRRRLLLELEAGRLTSRLVPWLVGSSVRNFECLLSRDELRNYHLNPLSSSPLREKWEKLAPLAVEAGHEARAVAWNVVLPAFGGWGEGIDRWSEWKARFESALDRSEGALREVAAQGLIIATEKLKEAEAEKRRYELTGRR